MINQHRPYPDATTVMNSAPRSLPGVIDLEINDSLDEDESSLDVTEKQAEMIRFLQTKNRNLSRQILELTERVQKYEDTQTNDSLLQDAQNVLELRNEEIRRLRTELDQLRFQLDTHPTISVNQMQQMSAELISTKNELERLKAACERLGHMDKLILLEEMRKDSYPY